MTTHQPRVVHCKREAYDVYVGRPSKWGNPFPLTSEEKRAQVIEQYKGWLAVKITEGKLDPTELRGKTLACWCAPKPCHADVLLEAANA